ETALAGIQLPDAPDLGGVETRLGAVETALAGISLPDAPDLGGVETRLGAVETALAGIQLPDAPDLGGLETRLGAVETALGGMSFPAAPDLAPMSEELGLVRSQLAQVHESLSATAGKAELAAVVQGLAALPSGSPDFGGLESRMDRIQTQLDAMSGKVACPTLEGLGARIDELAGKIPASFAAERRDDGSKNLLRRAAFGRPDDLKKISGVGPVLEAMLHDLGVYYFWQVSDWTPEDVAFVDDRLTAFKGRIERDNWVSQAVRLAKSGAPRPQDVHTPTNGNGWGMSPAPSLKS
ncbi:MAG: hypothetical protein AAFZ18_36150, partial [Myxococcota bacterium]